MAYSLEQGFRQGCLLAPLPFNIFFTAVLNVALTFFCLDSDIVHGGYTRRSVYGGTMQEVLGGMVRGGHFSGETGHVFAVHGQRQHHVAVAWLRRINYGGCCAGGVHSEYGDNVPALKGYTNGGIHRQHCQPNI